MYSKFNYQKAMPTPWGKADYVHHICKGVVEVGTPGHGGILVGKAVARKLLSPKGQAIGREWNQYLAYEEDCDWSLFAYEQPELYNESRKISCSTTYASNPEKFTVEETKRYAAETLKRWHQDYFTG